MKNKILISFIFAAALGGIVFYSVQHNQQQDLVESDNTSQSETIAVDIEINTGSSTTSYSAQVQSGSTALDVLQTVASSNNFEVKITHYDFGDMIDGINGIESDLNSNRYWFFYVNDESSTVGASSYVVAPGDRIMWKFGDAQ